MNLMVDIPTTAIEKGEGEEGLRLSEMEMKMQEQAYKRCKMMSYSLSPPSADVIPTRGIQDDSLEGEDEEDLPAWQGSDDEMLTVSLTTRGLLRKLRI